MKKLRYIIFALLVLALGTGALVSMGCSHLSVSPTSGLAENYTLLAEKVDRLFAKRDKPDSPGAAVVVLKNGKIVHQRGYGMANLEYGVPITPATIFDMASVSKQFIAMAIAILAKQKKKKPVKVDPQVYFERDINNMVTGFRANRGDGWVRNLYVAKQIE